MKTVEVRTGKPYNIVIGENLLSETGKYVKEITDASIVAVITDDIVNSLYADTVTKSLCDSGFSVVKFVFPNGESSKNIRVYSEILEFLAEKHLTRSDCLVALGGGVVGDMAGFAAATYLRGISFVQIPTTLLASVDSSVGGKTAVDLNAGKNLAGAFYQPSLVLCDYSTLSTLSDEIFSDGMAEVIKYGAVFDKDFLMFLKENDAKENLEYIIEKCVCFKRDVVNVDETDRGIRGLLNFGHTVGHAIEKCSDFKISHGSAVAIGMVIASRGAYKCSLTDVDATDIIIKTNLKYNLPISTDFDAQSLYNVSLSDKKRSGSSISLVIPEKIGKCILYKTNIEFLKEFIIKGLN